MRIGVTTTADTADRVAGPLADAGLDPVILPCIRVEEVDTGTLRRVREEAMRADWVLVTSVRAVRTTWPGGDLPSTPFAAVGTVTARAITAAGGRVEAVGEGGAAELAELIAPEVSGSTVLHPVAAGADGAVTERLRRAGARVIRRTVYTTHPHPPGDDPVDGAIFASPSAVNGWRSGRSLDELAVVAAIGPTTAAALARHGRVADIVPHPPGLEAIVTELAAVRPSAGGPSTGGPSTGGGRRR